MKPPSRRALIAAGAAVVAVVAWLVRRPAPAPPLTDGTLRLDWTLPPDSGARYRLEVRVDGGVAATEPAMDGDPDLAGALRVFREVTVAPGTHSISVVMTRADSALRRPAAPSPGLPPTLGYSGLVTFSPGEVVVVTYDAKRQRLMAHRSSGR